VGEAVYTIDDFPDDNLLWRIEWIGGVGFNTSVPSDPLMDVCIAQPTAGETNPLSARFCTVANNVGDSVALNLAFNNFDCFGMAAASTGDKGPRCQPPSAVHRHVIVSNRGVGGTDECYSQKQLPFRCVLA
jgi:hypothetical protein